MANYKVSGNNVIANVSKLTDKELKTVRNYLALGYTLVSSEESEVVPKKKNPKYTMAYIKEFLKKNGTPEQLKHWEELMEEQAIDKETGEPKFNKKGKPVKKGIVNTFRWLKETFPEEYNK